MGIKYIKEEVRRFRVDRDLKDRLNKICKFKKLV